jgi:hypothetical protein
LVEKRVYTGVSAKAVKGLKRLVPERDIYVATSPAGNGYTVVTIDKDARSIKDEAKAKNSRSKL